MPKCSFRALVAIAVSLMQVSIVTEPEGSQAGYLGPAEYEQAGYRE
ncbi:hypothetical protein [Peribacillus sp. RS7]